MGTQIIITPPGGTAQEIKVYSQCQTALSATSRSGSFSLTFPDVTGSMIDAFPIGSDVQIIQGDHLFRGWVVNPAKAISGAVKNIQLEGLCYTGRTQKILVSESYVDQTISYIVDDLFTKYMPWVDRNSIVACGKVVTIAFRDEFLFDCMEKLCELSGYEWVIFELLPEEIEQDTENSGWAEVVEVVSPITDLAASNWGELVQCNVAFPPLPSDTLYPSETLYPQ